MSDERLGWACVESHLLSMRGKDAATKKQVMTRLNRSQQALCMFRVFYDHAKNSAGEYHSWISILLQEPGYWAGVIGGLRYFEDENLIHLLEETKLVIEREHEPSGTIDRLYVRFQEIESDSLKRISTFIRSNPQDFVLIEG